ncbi:MAG TPA: hypothetical protein P5306_01270 [Kiritimatiellia bacterium]|nr:hypothetical protein [Kiritimatiellia bacterium]HRX05699.1 hypothetical protein [Kiritimatiellia bacterium]
MADEDSPDSTAQDRLDSALDLNFVPTWARKPPENPYAGREDPGHWDGGRGRGAGRRDDRRGGGRREPGDRRGFRSGPGGARPRGAPGFGGSGRSGGRRFPDGGGGGRPPRPGERREPRSDRNFRSGPRDRPPRREPRPRLDVKVTFLPDRERLALVVRDIQAGRRAFPLVEIASRFLSREDLYLVKLEMAPPSAGAERQTLVQCLECRRVFRSRANAEAHVVQDHLDKFFHVEETEAEPPAGNFTCVARCGLSGALLGPPNHHGYNEKIQEVWSSRFAHLSKADYLAHIETLRDEALVEQWKESVRRKTVYRLKDVPEGEEAPPQTRAEAQEWMGGRVKAMLRESPRSIVPGPQSRKFDDGALRAAVSAAWQKESRFPLTLLLALRPAFRHMRLHLFKVNAKETYVTAIPPSPVDLASAPEIVREIVAFLEAHPGIPRQQVLDQLRPGADPESSGAAELLLHLGNLVANGGVIEFFDGTLALPRSGPVRSAEEANGKPAAESTDGEGGPEAAAAAVAETASPEASAPGAADETPDVMPEDPAAVAAAEPPAGTSAEAEAPAEEATVASLEEPPASPGNAACNEVAGEANPPGDAVSEAAEPVPEPEKAG